MVNFKIIGEDVVEDIISELECLLQNDYYNTNTLKSYEEFVNLRHTSKLNLIDRLRNLDSSYE